ncbi:hypothetical protein OROHE_022996 [Orobanche hederae]
MAWTEAGLLVCKIASLLENEASLIGGIEEQLHELKDELISMRSFLVDADKKRVQTAGEQSWVANVTAMVYDVEDVMEQFIYNRTIHHLRTDDRRGISKLIHQSVYLPKNLYSKHQLAKKLENMNEKIKSISERRQRYGVATIQVDVANPDHRELTLAESAPVRQDDDFVGFEDDLNLIMGWLQNEEPHLSVFPVVGMGGSGKTTLVAKAYQSKVLKRHFDRHAWITVSQNYDPKTVLRSMIKDFSKPEAEPIGENIHAMNYRDLVELLAGYLRTKRYILVLDDVWSVQLWTEIKASLPNEARGSRIILTTRMEDVALFSFGVESHVHRIDGLTEGDAWSLFSRRAFQQLPGGSCPNSLEHLARELVKKCRGLPLAIVSLAGVMSTKQYEREWRMNCDTINSELGRADEPLLEKMTNIIWISFLDLPYPLKRCFLYCSLFPEDCDIIPERVIRMWIAEGFVEKFGNMRAEDVAETYLVKLVNKSMIQVVKRNAAGRLKRCRMHDLMRDIALSTSRMQKFCGTFDDQEASSDTGVRRLQLFRSNVDRLNSWNGMPKLRTLVVSRHVGKISSASLALLLRTSRFLRLLDLQSQPIEELPDELANLFNLRYLNIRMTKVKELPNFIGRLRNLETLDLRDTKIDVLQNGITKLHNLRSLLTSSSDNLDLFQMATEYDLTVGTRIPPNLCNLKNLQVLDRVQAETELIKHIRSMTWMRRLGITNLKEEHMEELCISIQRMSLLHFLHLTAVNENESLCIDALSEPPPYLELLFLGGILKRMPQWMSSLHSLTSLSLHWSRLKEDPVPFIQALPNLEELHLNNAFTGKQLLFGSGFPKLKELYILGFHRLEEMGVERGAMPVLETMHVVNCLELKRVPNGIQCLTNLQELGLFFVPNEVVERIYGEDSIDRKHVQHILKIILLYQSASGLIYETLPKLNLS